MARIRTHGAMWLATGLWAAAVALDLGILFATLSPPVPQGKGRSTGTTRTARPDVPSPEDPARPVHGLVFAGEARIKIGRARPPVRPEPWGAGQTSGVGKGAGPPPRGVKLDAVVHAVAQGETLISIVRGYMGTSSAWREVAAANGIEPPHVLRVGRTVRIPAAKVARTESRAVLRPPRESARELAARALLGKDVNPPPPGAFLPPDEGLRLVHPFWEVFPWRVPVISAAGFAALAFAAGVVALSGAGGRVDPARAARALGWAAAASGGFLALAGGAAVLVAEAVARSALLQAALAIAAGGGAGVVAYLAGAMTPGRDGRSRLGLPAPGPDGLGRVVPAAVRRFGMAVGVLAVGGLLCASAAGWISSALLSLRLPG